MNPIYAVKISLRSSTNAQCIAMPGEAVHKWYVPQKNVSQVV